jgi:hypothetical protein
VRPITIGGFAILAVALALQLHANGSRWEFEGKYRVGEARCEVQPIKMAFEVRCPRQDGLRIFFYEWDSRFGKHTFVSEETSSGVDRFVFADEAFAFGVFLASDGTWLPVTRLTQDSDSASSAP